MAPMDYTPPANPHALHNPASQDASAAAPRTWKSYTVRPGDSLAKLAVQHHTSIATLVKKNNVSNPRHLEVGRELQLPGAAPTRSAAPAPKPAAKPAAALSQKNASPVTKAAAPAKKAAPAAKKAPAKTPARAVHSHTVARGETLSAIGIHYGTGWSALMKANHLSDPHQIKPGQVLKIPVRPGQPAAKPATKPAHPAAKAKAASSSSSASKDNTFAGRTYPDHVVKSAHDNRERLKHVDVPSRSQTRDLIVSTARRYGVDPKLALAIGWQESGWNQRAVSVANAVGVMQVMPGTGEWCGDLVGRKLNLMEPRDNVTAGVAMLRWLTTHAGSRDEAIAGYYQGLGGVQEKGMYADTKVYVRSVNAHMKRF